ncbi:alpha-galactosidase [Paucilactobacillus nenjiangensis]|uniref:Alpha-galactosidase n=1 Tax=Paucilactobacillus nenjiangensis TaxID=1296540 RepID=A0A5P1X7P4_9LACO|nr:alpha-galactosidase [Paucilactobacillus nenjiangensis]QER68277.1 alpha-galactosidase [Paucilactobacillus nenjiangensis]
MPVEYDPKTGLINLHNDQISYVIQILAHRYPVHRYFGRYFSKQPYFEPMPSGSHAFANDPTERFPYSVTSLPLEYSTIGSGDYRQPAYVIKDANNQLLPILEYTGFSVNDQPINSRQLPPTVSKHTPVTILVIHLADAVTKLQMDLNYTIFENQPLILRSTTLRHHGTTNLQVTALSSAQLDLPTDQYTALTLSGTHAHEANPSFNRLHPGLQTVRSLRGTSGPQHQPFMALAEPNTTELAGTVIGCALAWSGNFDSTVEVDQYQHSRLTIGLEPDTFEWQLKPNSSFQTPEAVLTWTNTGFNGMSQVFHDFSYQLMPSQTNIPSVLNTWETLTFAVSESKVQHLIEHAHQLGLQMLVLDDGWFVNRNGENGQLGDWFVDPIKFPNGLNPLAQQAHYHRMKFGLWVEPEMITTNSKLYQQHPDWVLQYVDRTPITARHQLVLDLSQAAVRDHLITTLTNLVQNNQLDYLKWDMNRHLTQVGSTHLPAAQQGELYYRYVCGLYDILTRLKRACPKLIIENCSAGGGRFDFGMLPYTNQTWISDLTDPADRATIENGFSYLFPPRIFSNHITSSPNAQNGRITTFETRLQLACIGQLGLELNPKQLAPSEQQLLRGALIKYQQLKSTFIKAHFYRLPTTRHVVAWLLVTADKKQAICYYLNGLNSAVKTQHPLPLHYLDAELAYSDSSGNRYTGHQLNTMGIPLKPTNADFTSQLIYLCQN